MRELRQYSWETIWLIMGKNFIHDDASLIDGAVGSCRGYRGYRHPFKHCWFTLPCYQSLGETRLLCKRLSCPLLWIRNEIPEYVSQGTDITIKKPFWGVYMWRRVTIPSVLTNDMSKTFTYDFDTPVFKGTSTLHTGWGGNSSCQVFLTVLSLFIGGKWVDPVEPATIEWVIWKVRIPLWKYQLCRSVSSIQVWKTCLNQIWLSDLMGLNKLRAKL